MKSKKRHIYLEKKSLRDSIDLLLSSFDFDSLSGEEEIETTKSLGRITSRPVFSVQSSPNYYGAAMDGIAVFSEDTLGAYTSSGFHTR